MWEIYRNLFLVAQVPVVLSVVFYYLKKKTKFRKWPNIWMQTAIGVAFGLAAVFGTECGVDVGGATANARDAAPLCAGLFFGAPAGIIAGLIGGLERWFAVYWGAGMYSRLACSLSTLLAGVFAGALRYYMFENKKPTPFFSLIIAVVMEVLHMTVLFLTHFDDVDTALRIVRICTLPMIVCNGYAVFISSVIMFFIKKEVTNNEKKVKRISQQVQVKLMVVIIFAYVLTTVFVYYLQTSTGISEANGWLNSAVTDLSKEITEASDKNILYVTRQITSEYQKGRKIMDLAEEYEVQEINIVSKNGIIVSSTNLKYLGFDMDTGAQSREFLCLLSGTKEYVQSYSNISFNPDDDSIARKYAGVALEKGGFVQVGYDALHFQDDIDSLIQDATRYRKIGSSGFLVICDSGYNIVSDAENHEGSTISEIGLKDFYGNKENVSFKATVYGEASYCTWAYKEGFFIIAVLPESEVFATRDSSLYINSFMEVLVFAVLFFVIYMVIRFQIVDKLHDINKSLGKIIDGDLSVSVDVHSSREFVSLSEDINTTVSTLKRYIAEASARIDKELAYAKTIQHSALPSVFPAYPGRTEFDIYATMDTAKEVGGDFYDFYLVGQDQLVFLMADVSGKGIPAAMFMMRAKTLIKTLAESGMPVSDVLTYANAGLCEGNDAEMFVTAWLGVLNTRTGHVSFANAGHNPPIICRKDGTCTYLSGRPGFVLGGMPTVKYRLQEVDLNPGDRIVLYTDGIVEAVTKANEMYGESRFLQYVTDHQTDQVSELLPGIVASVNEFAGEAEQFDDMTLLALDYWGDTLVTERVFPAEIDQYEAANAFLEEEMEKAGISPKLAMQIAVSFEELFVNVAHYAYQDKSGDVTVALGLKHNDFTIMLKDSGVAFNPLEKADPDITLSAEERQIGGLGIYMVKKTMDKMEYRRENDQNILRAVKKVK